VSSGTYYFRVAAYNANGQSGYSNTVSVTVGGGSTPTPSYSLEGTWEIVSSYGGVAGGTPGNQAMQVYVSGNTGYLSRSSNSPLWQDAANKGKINVNDPIWTNLRSTGNLTWSGRHYLILVRTNSPDVFYAGGFVPCTITMSSNGQTITIAYSWSYEGYSGNITETWKRL
jgi:hypothetical protein